jgi:hypothetical protein
VRPIIDVGVCSFMVDQATKNNLKVTESSYEYINRSDA